MKRILLGISFLLAIQTVTVFANEEQQLGFKKLDSEQIDSLQAVTHVEELDLSRARSNGDGLPPVGLTIFSKSASAIFSDGAIIERELSLTVLNKGNNLARIRIDAAALGVLPATFHEFLLGNVDGEYFGTSVDLEGTIVLKRVSRKYIEVTYTRIVDATGLPIQVRAKFKL